MVIEAFQVVERADRNGQGDDHGETGVDGAGDKIGREDGRVPTRQNGDREIEADDGMHRQDQGSRQTGQKQGGRLIAHPVLHRAPPAERNNAVEVLGELGLGVVAHRSQVGNHAYVPEDHGDGGIGGNREDVP